MLWIYYVTSKYNTKRYKKKKKKKNLPEYRHMRQIGWVFQENSNSFESSHQKIIDVS